MSDRTRKHFENLWEELKEKELPSGRLKEVEIRTLFNIQAIGVNSIAWIKSEARALRFCQQ